MSPDISILFFLSVFLKISSGTVTYKDGIWSWTVPQSTYWENNNIKTSDIFDGSSLTQATQLQVRVDNLENSGVEHYYSNYSNSRK